jgi:hypothetical protein
MVNNFDFNDAGEQRKFDVIPNNTLVAVQFNIKPGGAGKDPMLTCAGDGKSEHLNVSYTVLDGPHKKRKIFERMTVQGTTQGHADAAKITRGMIRAMLESARGIKPKDESDAAKTARQITSYSDLDGLCFLVRVGVLPPSGNYDAKNTIKEIVTPDSKDWKQIERPDGNQSPAAAAPAAPAPAPAPAAAIARPQWGN